MNLNQFVNIVVKVFYKTRKDRNQKNCSKECGYKSRTSRCIDKIDVMEHVGGDKYRKKFMHNGRTINRYYVKKQCRICGKEMYQERCNSLKKQSLLFVLVSVR